MNGGRQAGPEAVGSHPGSPLHPLGSLGQGTQPLCARFLQGKMENVTVKLSLERPGTIKYQLLLAGPTSVPGRLCLGASCHHTAWGTPVYSFARAATVTRRHGPGASTTGIHCLRILESP